MTGEDLADRLQVDPKTTRRWLSGRAPYPKHRAGIAALLDVSVAELWPELVTDDGLAPRSAEVVSVTPAASALTPDWRSLIGEAQRRVDLLDLTLGTVLTSEEDADLLSTAAARGCHVRVLLSDRDSVHLAIAEQELGAEATLSSRPALTTELDRVMTLLAALVERRDIDLRTFVGAGAYSLQIFDDEALITLRVPGVVAADAPRMHVTRESRSVYDTFSRHFEATWRSAQPVT